MNRHAAPAQLRKRVGDVLNQAQRRIAPVSDSPALDARLLLGAAMNVSRTWLSAHPEDEIPAPAFQEFMRAVEQRAAGVPLPYLLGEWEFYGLKFAVSPDVLIPRPETEILVDLALQWLKMQKGDVRVLDVGTGSGCLAVAIGAHAPGVEIMALDISQPALRLAAQNAHSHGLKNMVFLESDLLQVFSNAGTRFNLICANLPYIPHAKLLDLNVYRHEPALALDGGPDGLKWISRLLLQAGGRLAPGGLMLLELEASQGESAAVLAQSSFPSAEISIQKDLAGRDRVLRIETPDGAR